MQIGLIHSQILERSPRKKHKLPCCPRCEHPELLSFEGEAFCMSCDWDSIEANVESRILIQADRSGAHTRLEALKTPSCKVGAA